MKIVVHIVCPSFRTRMRRSWCHQLIDGSLVWEFVHQAAPNERYNARDRPKRLTTEKKEQRIQQFVSTACRPLGLNRSNDHICPRPDPRKGDLILQRADMQTLGLGDRVVPIPRQRDPPARFLVPRPGQRRIEVVAPVHEDRPGLDLVDEVQVRFLGAGPDRRGEAVPRIVDQRERFGVVFDLPWGGVGRAVLENIVEHFGMSPVRSLLGRKERQQEREREREGRKRTFMMPNTGPNVSSDMTFISCVTLTNTCGATYVVPSFASGKSDSGMSALAPFETAGGRAGSRSSIGSDVSAFGRAPTLRPQELQAE